MRNGAQQDYKGSLEVRAIQDDPEKLPRDNGGSHQYVGDFEKSLKDNLEAYFKTPSEHAAAATISFYYAALLVLIDNPEEGDIKKIMEKLGDIVVFRPDICGSDALEMVEAVTLNALKVLAELTKGIGDIVDSVKKAEGEAVPETTGDKPIIH